MGLINQFLERKVMLVVYLQSLGAEELKVLGCKGVLGSWVVFLPIYLLLIKRILLPILYCAYLMYIGLMNMFNYIIYLLSI